MRQLSLDIHEFFHVCRHGLGGIQLAFNLSLRAMCLGTGKDSHKCRGAEQGVEIWMSQSAVVHRRKSLIVIQEKAVTFAVIGCALQFIAEDRS